MRPWCAQGLFQIDGAGGAQPGGLEQRLGRDVDGELRRGWVHAGDRHAGAIERNAVAQAHIVEVARRGRNDQPLAVRGSVAKSLHGGDLPHAGDDSCKHGVDCGRVWGRSKLVAALYPGQHAQVGADALHTVEIKCQPLCQPIERPHFGHAAPGAKQLRGQIEQQLVHQPLAY